MELTGINLTKKYGEKTALQGVSFSLQEGIYGLLGPNGAGKTTLISLLAGILRPSEGQVLWERKDIRELKAAYREILGLQPQNAVFYPDFTAEEFLRYIAAVKGLKYSRKELNRKIQELLEAVHLFEDRHRKLKEFSGGMKQRVSIAQALLGDPKLLLLDEPTAGLDPSERVHLRNLIATVALQKIVIWTTHIVSDISGTAREVLILKDGRLMKQDTPAGLIRDLKGHVFTLDVPKEQAESYQARFTVGNVQQREQDVRLRIIGDDVPNGAVCTEPQLEDVYLYYFERKGQERDGGKADLL